MPGIEGFILLGGASSRMGTDKAQLTLDGKRFVDRIASALSVVAGKTFVVGSNLASDVWELPQVADIYSEWGALGGLHAALASCQSEWAAVVACDLPFVTGELFVRLASFSENFQAVIPVQDDGRVQALCALYRSADCLPVAEELIRNGERRPRVMFERLKTRLVASSEFADLAHAELFFRNINTPEDYERAKRRVISDE